MRVKGGGGLKFEVEGADISPTAVAQAKKNFPALSFRVLDITQKALKHVRKQDVVIMSQLLWYILEKMPSTFNNLHRMIKNDGYLIFVNAFLHEQKYGRNVVDGFDGLVRYVQQHHFDQYRIVKAQMDYSRRFIHDDGILVLQKHVR